MNKFINSSKSSHVLDIDWVELLLEAKELGITTETIRSFLNLTTRDEEMN
ncbi:anti-repressor SinI family protein [Bacillus luteolus]|uniref:Anti-repressor SinI family protein n=1 Tax=Litchfieldia luteola TaxID=682179 RepID=A0ABR9QHH2_9BACI|nr:anti-repressor SinI family protein [Cytobacillus luteolus]MBE4907940.1 anti-repressor SinI family protein [Cytobacillus luteolus]MBP1942719.1 DNA-binding transcriptional MerR regulator [Cytobacillus luteolus]